MKTIRGKMLMIYTMIFIALSLTVIGAYIAVDTQQQHLILTELLSKQKLLVERVTFSTINASEIGLANPERFNEKFNEHKDAITQYTGDVDFMLNAFTIKEYPIDGKIVKLKFRDEFLLIFDDALNQSKSEWQLAKEEVDYLLNAENLSTTDTYESYLDEFRMTNLRLIEKSDLLTKVCREEATRKRIISNIIQVSSVITALIIFAFMVFMMNRDFRNPLMQIQGVFTQMKDGDFDLRLHRKQEDEFKVLFEGFNHFADSLETIRSMEAHVLREDGIFEMIQFIKKSFNDYVAFDDLQIIYKDTSKKCVLLSVEENILKETELDDDVTYNKIEIVNNKLILPIIINNIYIGHAQFINKEGFNDSAKKFIKSTSQTISFAIYKSLLFKDLLTIVTNALADLAESRDPETRLHLTRMSTYSQIIARQLAKTDKYGQEIDSKFISNIILTAPMHDIGKVSVPDSILLKPGKLTDEEFDKMKTHAYEGSIVLNKINERFEQYNLNYFEMAADIAIAHQEKYNGSGYPNGISGDAIPLAARISALADVFDALTSKRTYKDAFSLEKSYNIIKESKGSHFDPDIVDAFFNAQDEIEAIYNEFKEV